MVGQHHMLSLVNFFKAKKAKTLNIIDKAINMTMHVG